MTSYQVTASHWVKDGAGGHDWLVVGSHEHLQAAVAAGGGRCCVETTRRMEGAEVLTTETFYSY